MRQAYQDFLHNGGILSPEVDFNWLILGNIRTDVASRSLEPQLPLPKLAVMFLDGLLNKNFPHHVHAMRKRTEAIPDAYQKMRMILCDKMTVGCDPSRSWEDRALDFGSALHTLQDSYCTAHTARMDNGDPYSPIMAMHTYPSREHPFSTHRDAVWADEAKTAFKPEAAAAIAATVEALKIFAAQSPEGIARFLDRYVLFRADLYA